MSTFDLAPLHAKLIELAPLGRTALLPALYAAQALYGYLPETVAAEVGRALGAPLAEVHGVLEFYSLFYTRPVGKTVLHVCTDLACALAGGEQMMGALCRHLEVTEGGTNLDGEFTIERAPCLGLCEQAPAVLADERPFGRVGPEQAAALCMGQGQSPTTFIGGDVRLLTANCGKGRTTHLEEAKYRNICLTFPWFAIKDVTNILFFGDKFHLPPPPTFISIIFIEALL